LRTVETLPGHRPSTVHEAGGTVRPGPRATVGLVGVLAATLAFGLLGLLVGVWQLRRGRRSADLACRSCRRRRGLALAGTFLLAGLVVVGSGMALHQTVSGPRLPQCDTQLREPAAATLDRSLGRDVGAIWLQTRQALTAPISGLARHYVADRGGGLCQGRSMTLAFLPSAASDASFAVGSTVVTDQSSMTEGNWKPLARHESRHVTQWATLTLTAGPLTMPLLYAADEAFFPQSRNHFERAADLDDGGYPQPEDFGPRPQWTKVGVIGMLLFMVVRRRLRWTSRVFAGGPAAAVARQPGLCPLHSRGWFRLEGASCAPALRIQAQPSCGRTSWP
jgi:hypothetical protein